MQSAGDLLSQTGMWSISIVLRHLELAMRLQAAVPWLAPDVAYAHASAASSAQTEQVSAELLLGMAFVESRFDPTAVSRVEGGTRKTGAYVSTSAPPRLDRRASLYCGPLQTFAPSWTACLEMRNLDVAYAAGAAELGQWLRDRRVHGSTTRALAGHGCGNHGVLTGMCNGYPRRVLSIAQLLRSIPELHGRPPQRAIASS